MKYVIKRDGRKVKFNENKITNAIFKATKAIGCSNKNIAENCTQLVTEELTNRYNDDEFPEVEEIQDLIESILIQQGYEELAKEYITYRYKRSLIREINTTDQTIKELLEGDNEYWNNENSNKDAKAVTVLRDYIAGVTSTDVSRRFLLPQEIVEAHDRGIIHFHDMDYFAQPISNCFAGSTKFITNKGIRTFDSCYDGEKVKVKDKDGIWRDATVKKYGKQSMNEVTFKTPRSTKTVICTSNHRWLLKNGSITTNLKVGDVLAPTIDSSAFEPKTQEELEAFCFGFALGDGSDFCKNNGVSIRLCGNKNSLLSYFIKANYQYHVLPKTNDYIVYNKSTWSKQSFLNNKGWKYMSLEQKIALFNGLLKADGTVKRNLISSSDLRICELIEDISCLAGYYILSVTDYTNGTNYKDERFLRAYKFITYQQPNWCWKVVDIKPNRRPCYKRDAWCVEEPVTHTFTLDQGMVTGNCELINLEDMLQNGTVVNGVMIEKPHKFITACTIATQIILGVSSATYGGATITLTHLAPFVRDSYNKYLEKYLKWNIDEEKAKEFAKLDTRKEVEAGVQTFNYQVNSMTNTNGQAPFLSVCMYLGETDEYKEELAMIIEEFLKQRIEGFKNEKGVYVTPAFPKLLYVLEEDNINEDSKYWYLTQLAAKCTAKRMVPDYISEKVMLENKINQYGDGDCYPCMGCRSFLTPWTTKGNPSNALNYKEGKGKYYGRFNQGVVTINLPDVGLSADGNMKRFWKILDQRLELCHKALQERHNRLKTVTAKRAPLLWQYGALARLDKDETIEKLLVDNYSTLSLGYAGLYECVKAMTGKSHTDPETKQFALDIMQHLNDKCNEWKEKESIGYSLYGTPIESTTYKFAKCLKERFGEDVFIKLDGKDRNYITNSYHVPVFEEINAFEKLKLESEFQRLSPGGAISYIETPNLQNNIESVLQVIKFIYDNIMYAELNTKSDYCQKCGYDGEILLDDNLEWYCPNCGNRDHDTLNVARRTCGYIGSNFWNKGRTQEIKERVLHLDNKDA